jgi:hypothetical protein
MGNFDKLGSYGEYAVPARWWVVTTIKAPQRLECCLKHLTYTTKTDSCCWTFGQSTGYEGGEEG